MRATKYYNNKGQGQENEHRIKAKEGTIRTEILMHTHSSVSISDPDLQFALGNCKVGLLESWLVQWACPAKAKNAGAEDGKRDTTPQSSDSLGIREIFLHCDQVCQAFDEDRRSGANTASGGKEGVKDPLSTSRILLLLLLVAFRVYGWDWILWKPFPICSSVFLSLFGVAMPQCGLLVPPLSLPYWMEQLELCN